MKAPELSLWYAPEGYRTDGAQLIGRHAAGEAWLRACLADPGSESLACVTVIRAVAGLAKTGLLVVVEA